MPNITIKNLSFLYGDKYALRSVNLQIKEGDFVNIIGESGGGKTTLLKCLAGILSPSTGEIFFDDEIVNFKKSQFRDIAMIFQEFDLYPSKNVFENVMMPLYRKTKISFDEKTEMTRQILKKLDLESIANQLPKELSYGQKQKVALAKALVSKPSIILFDEPLSNIDEPKKQDYRHLLLDAKRIYPNSTYLYVTHNIQDALMLGEKTIMMKDGAIQEYGKTTLMYRFPSSLDLLTLMRSDYLIDKKRIAEISLTPFESVMLQFHDLSREVALVEMGGERLLYDLNGQLLTGPQRYFTCDGDLTNTELVVNGKSYSLGDLSEGVISTGKVSLLLRREYISFEDKGDSIRIDVTHIYGSNNLAVFLYQDKPICLWIDRSKKVSDKSVFYYPINKIDIVAPNGDKCISQYFLEENMCLVKVLNPKQGIVKLANQLIIRLGTPIVNHHTAKLKVPLDAFIPSSKKGVRLIKVINEEYLGKNTLIYAKVEGFLTYVNFIIPDSHRLLSKKNRFLFDTSKIQIVNE